MIAHSVLLTSYAISSASEVTKSHPKGDYDIEFSID